MSSVLKNVLQFSGLAIGVPSALPHGLNRNSVAEAPKIVLPRSGGFVVTADATNVTVIRVDGGATLNVYVELWHSYEDAEPLPNGIPPAAMPFIIDLGSGSGGDITGVIAGANLTGGGLSGTVTVALNPNPSIDTLRVGGALPFKAGEKVAIRGNQNQLSLENETGPTPFQLLVENSGDTIWDISPVTKDAIDDGIVRFFRRTNTAGSKRVDLSQGNTATIGLSLRPNGGSFFLTLPGTGTAFGNHTAPLYPVDARGINAGQVASNRIINGETGPGNTYNTTAGALSSHAGHFDTQSTRSAGANPLTNVGVYTNANGGQVNWGIYNDSNTFADGALTYVGELITAFAAGNTNNAAFTVDFVLNVMADVTAVGAVLTGIVAGVNGRIISITNTSAVIGNIITVTHQDAASTAGNRFSLPANASLVIPNGGSQKFRYDLASTSWRPW